MLQICQKDRVAYSVGAPACPQCGHTEFWLEGQEPPLTEDDGQALVDGQPAVELTDTEKEAGLQATQARSRKTKTEPTTPAEQ
jgi:hypothetical protein